MISKEEEQTICPYCGVGVFCSCGWQERRRIRNGGKPVPVQSSYSKAKLKELLRFHYPVCTDTEKEILSMFRELEAERDHYKKYAADIETRLADAVETLKYYANATWDDGGFEGEHAKIILCAGNEAGYKRAKDCLSRISGGQPSATTTRSMRDTPKTAI